MKKMLGAAVAVLLLSVLSACATLNDDNFQAQLATQYATIKIIDGDREKAAKVESIATEVQHYASGEPLLTVDLLVQAIRARVPWHKLDAADELLVNALIDQLRIELIARLGENQLPEDLRLAVDTVSAWVISAAQMS